MKAEEIIKKEEIPEDECEVCYLHDKAHEVIGNKILCPHCGKDINDKEEIQCDMETIIVEETNTYESDETIENMLVVQCKHCNKYIGFKAIPIIYNGNHDIYYTGGKDYLPNEKIKISDEIKKNIKQYTDRIKAGENLQPYNLELWIEYEIEHIIAETLYKHGYKY